MAWCKSKSGSGTAASSVSEEGGWVEMAWEGGGVSAVVKRR